MLTPEGLVSGAGGGSRRVWTKALETSSSLAPLP